MVMGVIEMDDAVESGLQKKGEVRYRLGASLVSGSGCGRLDDAICDRFGVSEVSEFNGERLEANVIPCWCFKRMDHWCLSFIVGRQ
jgi:hypothetical protein